MIMIMIICKNINEKYFRLNDLEILKEESEIFVSVPLIYQI